MNAKLIYYLKSIIECKEINYTVISEKTKIEYQRLLRIFNQGATISGSELICICKLLEVKQADLMAFIDEAA